MVLRQATDVRGSFGPRPGSEIGCTFDANLESVRIASMCRHINKVAGTFGPIWSHMPGQTSLRIFYLFSSFRQPQFRLSPMGRFERRAEMLRRTMALVCILEEAPDVTQARRVDCTHRWFVSVSFHGTCCHEISGAATLPGFILVSRLHVPDRY